MERLDLLLKIIVAADGEKVTPAQLQKVAFLVGMEFPQNMPNDYYVFEKYHYGPFCADVYWDAEQLERDGMIAISVHPRGGWREYAATVRGSRIDFMDIPVEMTTFIEDKVSWARGLSFQQLVREVYIQFPEYQENSVFQY